jgi:hypothetical protein
VDEEREGEQDDEYRVLRKRRTSQSTYRKLLASAGLGASEVKSDAIRDESSYHRYGRYIAILVEQVGSLSRWELHRRRHRRSFAKVKREFGKFGAN